MFRRKTPVNVVLIQPTGYIHSMALLEATEYFAALVRKCGYPATLSKNTLKYDRLNIIIGAHLIEDINVIPEGSIIFNSEQFGDNNPWFKSKSYNDILESFCVWDYSLPHLIQIKSNKKFEIPFFYCEDLVRIEKKYRDIDLLFYGSMNERRLRIIEDIRRAGIDVQVLLGIYGPERDAIIARSRAILNLHYYETQVLEQGRCFYPLINGKPVISENYPLASAPEGFQSSLFLPGDRDLAEYVTELLHDKAAFDLAAYQKTAAFRGLDPLPPFRLALTAALAEFARVDHRRRLPTRMNLGSGKDYRFGCLNVDVNPSVPSDLTIDFSKKIEFPFQTSSDFGEILLKEEMFDEIIASHILEHIPDLPTLMTQCLYLLKTGGRFTIEVPYELSVGAWRDPTHVRAFNEGSWFYYTQWFWYMGWFSHRFECADLRFKYSALGERLKQAGTPDDEIVRTPRAIDAMMVTLVKCETTIEEKQFARSYDSHFHLGGRWDSPAR